jgi:conjugal transfer mating pair stabilization protein TraN
MNCSDYSEFKQFNGHYYSISIDKLTFESANQIAKNNGGTLAIPNSQEENDFIKNLIGGGSIGWIGIYDPNQLQNYCYGTNCIYDSSRFKDVKNNSLFYKNFYSNQPDNLVKEYDVVDSKQMVSPLGEHWVAMNGNNGKWYDFGNHADQYNNPVKYKAIFEFENLNECKPLTDDGVQELTGLFCNTKIWDTDIDTKNMGQTLSCQIDIYNNTYCPSALAECGEQWDYEDGFSIKNTGNFVEYASKISVEDEKDPNSYMSCSKGKYDPLSGQCIYGGLYQITLNKNPEPDAYIYWKNDFSNPPTFFNIKAFVNGAIANREPYICGYNVKDERSLEVVSAYVWYLGRCPESDAYTYWYNDTNWSLQTFMDGATQECSTRGACPYTPPLIETSPANLVNECAVGYKYDSFINKCVGNLKQCPNGYTETVGNDKLFGECKRTKEYTYYIYNCTSDKNSQGYTYKPITTGGNCNPKYISDLIDTNGDGIEESCNNSTPPINNCKREKFLCQANKNRPCSYVDNKWQCSPFPCMGQSNFENLDTQVGISDKDNDGWSEDGACTGTIYIFNGKSNKCRTWDMLFGLMGGGCCDKEKVFAGLVSCKENEKLLAKQREQKQAHYIGNFCSKQLKLGLAKICVQKSDSYCTFSSSLAKIIQEQGREQLGISWGSAENPECRGFTPEEFQKIDFSKIDLTEFVEDIQSSIQTSVIQNLGTYVRDKVEDFYGN